MPRTDKYQRSATVVMKPGDSEDKLRPVLTAGKDLNIPVTEFPLVDVQPDGRGGRHRARRRVPRLRAPGTRRSRNCWPASPSGSRS